MSSLHNTGGVHGVLHGVLESRQKKVVRKTVVHSIDESMVDHLGGLHVPCLNQKPCVTETYY